MEDSSGKAQVKGASPEQADRLATVVALGEPLRRNIYLFLVSEQDLVSRDQAAERFGVSRAVAAFHLDKLAEVGLVDVEFKRPPGRGGPGAGRPTKLYRPRQHEASFSIPPREYELAGRLLAEAVTSSRRDGVPVETALHDAACNAGRAFGKQALDEAGDGAKPGELVNAGCEVLRRCAYEPARDARDVVLNNCPFHSLAVEYRDLVCGMNLALMEGFTEELAGARLEARLDPQPPHCCVRLVPRR